VAGVVLVVIGLAGVFAMFAGRVNVERVMAGSVMTGLFVFGKALGSPKAVKGAGDWDTWTMVWVSAIVLMVVGMVLWRVWVEMRE
jgi:lipopolysaccharide export LptBFGC system permease protein LptF